MKTLVAVVLFLAACHTAIAQQAEVKHKGKELNYGELVEGLVSPNKPIRISNYPPTISVPPKFDWKAQRAHRKESGDPIRSLRRGIALPDRRLHRHLFLGGIEMIGRRGLLVDYKVEPWTEEGH